MPAFAATLVSAGVVLSAATAAAQQNGAYPDVDLDAYYATPVRDLAAAGVFAGTECDKGFCPAEALDRETMAVWMARVLDGADPPAAPRTRFDDVDNAGFHARFIERMAELGVTRGCGDGRGFCPDRNVTRAQMAAFLSRAHNLPDGPDPGFVDVPSDAWYAADVARLAASGITVGCGDGRGFCPGRNVTRAQMATFLHRAISRDGRHPGPPKVAIDSTSPLVTSGRFEVGIRFSRPVTGLIRSEIAVVNGRAVSLTGSGANYLAVIDPAADGAVMVSLPAGVAGAGDGTVNESSAPFVRMIAQAARTQPPGIDTWNRPLVLLSAYVEFSRDEPDWAYTGDMDRCVAGTTSQTFRDSVIQRVNWYRQMAGLNPVTENPALSDEAREAALIMLANESLSHYPSQDWACYSSAGAASAGGSNIGLGNAGVSGIDSYMQDSGDNNRRVGHRRWILYPNTLQMGTGNARQAGLHYTRTANALDVVRGDREGSRPRVREQRAFVSWPPSGYVHPATAWGRWSFSLAGADFSTASVAMADASGVVAVEILDRDSRVGEPAIVWAVAGDTNSARLPAPRDGDHCYAVTISGVRVNGEVQTPYEYPVCVVAPDAATGPSVTLASDAPDIVQGSFDVTVAFSERVNDFTSGDIFVINGTVESFSGSGADYEAAIRAGDNGTVLVAVGAGAAHNSQSLPNGAAIPLSRTADVGRPTVSVASPAPSAVSGSFAVSIAFSEPVAGFSTSGIRVVNGTVSDLTGSGASYRATVTPSNDGTVMVRVAQDAAVAGSGRANQASTPLTRIRLASGAGRSPGIDTWDRAAVLQAFTTEFDRDEPDWGYTGDVDSCIAGTTSRAFRDSFLQRLNWYRGMAGTAAVTENGAYSDAAQQAALIYLANESFVVEADSRCYSEAGARAAGEGSSWLGVAGIATVDRYVAHDRGLSYRQAVLTPHLAEVGIGHARDPDSVYRVAHKMYADYRDPWGARRPAVREPRRFIAWPSPGYVPLETVPQGWSFSLPGADFSTAAVSVSDDFGPIDTTLLGTRGWYREETILWSVAEGMPLDQSGGPTDADPCYAVTISGVSISGSTEAPYEYAVCVLGAAG